MCKKLYVTFCMYTHFASITVSIAHSGAALEIGSNVPADSSNCHSTKKPVTTMLTFPWKCTVLHCNHLGNTWKPLVLMTRHFDYCLSASEVVTGFFAQCA